MKKQISEGKAKIEVFESEIVTKGMEVFYNPKMKLNRDISIEVIKNYFDYPIKVALPLAGSGIRGIRMLLENDIEKIFFNDLNPNAVKLIEKNISLNKKNIKQNEKDDLIEINNKDANIFLREKGKFDYVDIDPFGSSIYFLDSAINSIKRNGILAITNTDTAALCGSYPKVTKRRYGAKPFNNAVRQEFGIRILVRKAQEIGLMHDIALIPILSYSKEHYSRIFFKVLHSKQECEKIISFHGYVKSDENRILKKSFDTNDLGPIWLGKLYDSEFLKKIDIANSFIERLKDDSILDSIFYFYDPHEICKLNKKEVMSYEKLKKEIESKGYKMLRTHFYCTGILTDIPSKDLLKIILN